MRTVLVLSLLVAPVIAHAQAPEPPAEPTPPPPPTEPTPPPPPPEQAPPPPAPAPAPAPAAPSDDLAAACKEARRNIEARAATIDNAQERGRLLAHLPDCSHPTGGNYMPPALAADGAAAAFSATGLAFGVSLELAPTLLGGGSSGVLLPLPSTRVLIGYHADRVTFGLTFDLERVSVSQTPGMGLPSSDTAVTTMMLGPAFRATVASSETGATELLAVGDIAYRLFDISSSTSMGSTPDVGHNIIVHAGVSLQHWVDPHFALAATAAVRIDDYAPPDNTGGATADSSYGGSLSYSLDLLGVF